MSTDEEKHAGGGPESTLHAEDKQNTRLKISAIKYAETVNEVF